MRSRLLGFVRPRSALINRTVDAHALHSDWGPIGRHAYCLASHFDGQRSVCHVLHRFLKRDFV